MKVRIYQSNNRDYTYMDYAFALTHNFNFKLDYKVVAELSIVPTLNKIQALNKLWNEGNNGTLTSKFKMRSLSVSDIIEIDNEFFYIQPEGFKRIDI